MTSILKKIEVFKRKEIAVAKAKKPLINLKSKINEVEKPRGFIQALEVRLAQGKFALIAEIKKASPSKGIIRADFDPGSLAISYEEGGAVCLSVLTDEHFFCGCQNFLTIARDCSVLPVLRKDFLYDTYQVYEARACGADCILIIMAAVNDYMAKKLEETAFLLGMDVLLEISSELELERALKLDSTLIGINNRNLNTFHTDLRISKKLAKLVPDNKIIVSESGISSKHDLDCLSKYGINAFLVGESIVSQDNTSAAIKALLSG